MKCEKINEQIFEALDGRLDRAAHRTFDAHLEACGACQEKAAKAKGTWDLLLEYPGIEPSPHFLARVKRRLGIPFGWKLAGGLLATAAAALLAFVFAVRPNISPDPGVDPVLAVTSEERELLEYLDMAENYEVVEALEVLIEMSGADGAQIFFQTGEEK